MYVCIYVRMNDVFQTFKHTYVGNIIAVLRQILANFIIIRVKFYKAYVRIYETSSFIPLTRSFTALFTG